MAPPPPWPKHPNLLTYHLMVVCILLLALASTMDTVAASTTTYSSACPSPASAADSHTDAYDAHSLARSFQIYNGHFSAGGAKEDDSFSLEDDQLHSSYHSFHLFPDRAARTSDPALVHLAATLDLTDPRRGRNRSTNGYVSFVLDGYYSSASLELCMVGSTSSATSTSDDVVVLRLRVPSPPTLADPFVTGTLEGSSDLGAIQLLAYAQGDDYEYGDSGRAAACSPPAASPPIQAVGVGGDIQECGHLIGQLVTSYRLVAQDQHRGGGAPARLLPQLMHVSQMQCTEEGAVRAYVVFSNDTEWRAHDGFVVGEAAAVAEGRWDSARGMLCLRACRVVRSGLLPPSTLAVGDCGIGMSFWFQAAWTVRARSVVAGMLWNTSTGAGAGPFSGVNAMSAFSIDDPEGHHTRNLSAVRYEYNDRMLEEAKKHYYLTISREKKMRGSFPVPMGNYDTYHDFSLRFFGSNGSSWSGEAHPVSIGSVMMGDDVLAVADEDSFSRHAVAGAEHGQLLSVSYDIHYDDHRGRNMSSSSHSPRLERQQIKAEGVYDPRRGILCMVGCREQHGSTPDCRVLVSVQFASMDGTSLEEGGRGVISSLRDRDDRLFFEQVEISLYGMYSEQLREAVSRMDMESVMLVASTTLSCVFAAAQILHTKRSPEAASATSVTMLAVLALGYLAPLALSFETLFASRRSRYGLLADNNSGWPDLNQVMVNVPALLAFVLHLRLLQLAISGRRRRTVVDQGGKPPVTTSARTVLKTCLPLYLLGAVLTAIVHAVKIRAASEMGLRVVRVEDLPAALRDDLVAYTGLIVDGFLLPQVILNASGGSGVAARAISPWFYMGNTVIRVMPHVYDLVRRKMYEQSMSPSEVYASPRGDLLGVAWDIVVPCGAALLALLLFSQQRLRIGGAS